MKLKALTGLTLAITTGCSTMSESLQLGAGIGAMTGGMATYAGHRGAGHSPSVEDVALGAGIGLGVGLLTSYLTHKTVTEDRSEFDRSQTDMHFGDLPPSPFILPQSKKKGAK